jgi:DNA-directed RNA polymerase beta' subunit
LDSHALLSAGATEFLKDAKLIRGQRNDDYWRAIKAGDTPRIPSSTFADEQFKALLKAAGVNLREEGTQTGLAPMLDVDVDAMAPHEVENASTFNFETMEPVKGGLFDIRITGGADGNRFSKISLPRKIPHPLFVEPIQRLLGVTGKKLEAILAGKEELHGETGPEAVEKALSNINIDTEIGYAKELIRSGTKTKRDEAVKRLNYLVGLKNIGITADELMISKIPVIPPKYRPIVQARGMDMVHDLNYLYHDLLEARENYVGAEKEFGDAGEEYMAMNNAVKAITGVREPINPRTAEQNVKGILKYAIGIGTTPKAAFYQRKVIGSAVDTVGRGVITADANLDMDEVGIPQDMAWTVFRPFVVRRLVREGMPGSEAVKEIKERTPRAKLALEAEMEQRPVVYNRAPSLHRYAYVAAWGKLRDDDAIGMPYHTLKGIGGDFDGDAINIHVPVSEEAVTDAKEKLLPSKSLLHTSTFETHLEPVQDYLAGLYLASVPKDEPVKSFASLEEAKKAFARGEISIRTPIRILENA